MSSVNDSDDTLPPTLPNYEVLPSFKSLHSVDTKKIVTEHLPNHPSWVKHASKINEPDVEILLSYSLWKDVVQQYIHRISSCVVNAVNKSKLKMMQRRLVEIEEELVNEFAEKTKEQFIDGGNDKEKEYFYRAFLGILCTTVFELVKSDMCNSRSSVIIHIKESIDESFSLGFYLLENKFAAHKNGGLIKESVYYIAGWLMHACMKNSRQRRDELSKCMIDLYELSTVKEGDTDLSTLPTRKVINTMEFGGLHFVSRSFYELIIRFEYVFITNLTPTKLAILGSSLIQKVYNTLKESPALKTMVEEILSVTYEDDIIIDLVAYLVKTYCRMRGKDFCRQMMATDFNNLGKSLRSKLAVLSDRESYKIEGAEKKKRKANNSVASVHEQFNSSIDSSTIDDESINDEDNLLQDN